jgi:hypothetical protein
VLTINSDNAYIDAQKVGMSAALCAPGSAFESDYTACQTCIVANSNSTNVSLTTYVDPEFASFLSFCDAQAPANSSNNASISSQLSLLSAASTVEVALSSKASEGLVSVVTQTQTQTQTVILTTVSIVTVGGVSSAASGKISSSILNIRRVAC